MKKAISITLVLMLILALISCGKALNNTADSDEITSPETLEGGEMEGESTGEAKEEQDNSTSEESHDPGQAESSSTSDDNGSSHNHGSSNSGSQATPSAHTHNWVAVTIHHEAEYKTVHHDAIQHQEQQLITAAWDENVLVSNAWDEDVYEIHYFCGGCGADFGTTPPSADHLYNHMINGQASNVYEKQVWVRTIHHDAVYQTVHHDAVYQTVWVTDKPAWDEKVLVKAAWDETYYKCSICGAKK
jgi:hypothetical protein